MKLRPNTWDKIIAEQVITQNEYKLPNSMNGAVVVDVGAHIGSFTLACVMRGASVMAFEPNPDNFTILAENIKESGHKNIQAFQCAVVGSHAPDPEKGWGFGIRQLTDHNMGMGLNTGHVDIFGTGDLDYTIINEAIDGAIRKFSVVGRVDLLKLDCEGAEWNIFEHGDFSRVSQIVAELHALPDVLHPFLEPYRGKSMGELTIAAVDRLRDQGFEVHTVYESPETSRLTAVRHVATTPKKKATLLWIGDVVVNTGYGRVTEEICTGLTTLGWDVHVLGIGYNGDPHNLPFTVYPAATYQSSDFFGISRAKNLITSIQPDVVVIQHDSWNVSMIVDNINNQNLWVPMVGYVAVDSENVRPDVAIQLRNLKHVLCHTQYGIDQLKAAGWNGQATVVPHGVDTRKYFEVDKRQARSGIPRIANIKDAFLFGVVNANQPRKRIDLAVAYFAAWWKSAGHPDNAFLYVHTNLDGAWDLRELADFCGIRGRVISTAAGNALQESHLPTLYNALDVMISLSEGESFGLTTLEGMACGVPQIAVRCGGMPSWAGDAIKWVDPSVYVFTPNRTNTKRWIAAEEPFVAAMQELYENTELRAEYSRRGLAKAMEMTWTNPVLQFYETLLKVLTRQKAATKSDALAEF